MSVYDAPSTPAAMIATAADGSVLPGERIVDYRVIRELGRGGMGVVYEARHETAGSRVAIKLLAAHLMHQPEQRQRFLREARACSRIEHAGLVKIFGFGELPLGPPYILMEFLDGQSLRELLRKSPMGATDIPFVLGVIQQIAVAAAAAHQAGVVHRDLKPENILLVRDETLGIGWRAKILDFGIAKLNDSLDTKTQSVGLGTPVYMSPEQCRAGVTADGRADVYSLGCILYEWLGGTPPFSGDAVQLLHQHVYVKPTPLQMRRSGLPAGLDALILRMLAKSPTRRPTMGEVVTVLSTPGRVVGAAHARLLWVLASISLMAAVTFIAFPAGRGQLAQMAQQVTAAMRGRVYIPGGRFQQGSDAVEIARAYASTQMFGCKDCKLSRFQRESPQRWVELSPYSIDRYEITWEQFADWLNRFGARLTMDEERRHVALDGVELVDPDGSFGWCGITYHKGRFAVLKGMESKPAVLLTWTAAQRFCAARGGRLPTEAEWEYAARGPESSRFPWGFNWPDCNTTAFGRWGEDAKCRQLPVGLDPVGSHPKDRSVFGVMDLGGNAAEWVLDGFREQYASCPDGVCRDPLVSPLPDAAANTPRIVRGGAWYRIATFSRSAGRGYKEQNQLTGDIGFRCVYPDKNHPK